VVAGDWVYNSTDGTWARVTARDSGTQLSVDANIFGSSEGYEIYPTPTWPDNIKECDGSTISDSESPLNGMKLPNLNEAGSYADSSVAGGMHLRGGTTAGILQEDQAQGHHHPIRKGSEPASGNVTFTASGASDTARYCYSSGSSDLWAVDPSTDTVNGTPRTGKETRPRSFSVVYIMRIK